ncbi:MAG: Na+/H+ antiporter NhaC family protein [Nocardioides sp.]
MLLWRSRGCDRDEERSSLRRRPGVEQGGSRLGIERHLRPVGRRRAADSGTVTSPMVPWNSCGAFMAATLGVSTLLYLPYAIFCYASPVLSIVYGFTAFRIERLEPVGLAEETS